MAWETEKGPMMILPYEWILENVEEEPMTIASKMILFRGEKVFRVGLKNHAQSPILFLVVFNLIKLGMQVEDVMYGIQGSGTGPTTMTQMTSECIGFLRFEGNLELFTTILDKKIVGSCTFSFRIVIRGTCEFYSYQLSDRLAKDQLWAALKNQQNLADVEFVVKDKTFPAHKAILAARGYPFTAESEKLSLLPAKDVLQRIRIDDVEPSVVEKFLHYIYTGEPMGTLADEGLFQLAEEYLSTATLVTLCEYALKKTEATQMSRIMDILNAGLNGGVDVVLSSSKIMPETDTEISYDRMSTFRCTLRLNESRIPTCIMEYQKEDFFFAYITGHFCEKLISNPVIHFACAKHRRFGLKVEDFYCSWQKHKKWYKMEPKKSKNSSELLLRFTVQLDFDIITNCNRYPVLIFDVRTVSTIGNYYYEMMNDLWLKDLWLAATNQKLTDVEIFIGTVKMMEAHRVILCARSPVLNESLNKINNTAEKSIVTFGEEFDKDIVRYFLKFLYTGRLKTSAKVTQMSQLAAMYEVETLKSVCQLLNANPPDAEEVTNHLLEL